jgi:hypothetical protein
VLCGAARAGDLVDREGEVVAAPGRLQAHERHADRRRGEHVEDPHLRGDDDEPLDRLQQKVLDGVGDALGRGVGEVRGVDVVAVLARGILDRGDARGRTVLRAAGRLVTRARAARFGRYCNVSIARSTRSFVSGLMLGWSFSTRETVWCDTSARRATSRMLGARPLGISGFTANPFTPMCTFTSAALPLCTGSSFRAPSRRVTVT